MRTINITIEGKTPLLLHRFTDSSAIESTEGTRPATNGDRGTPREQAEDCLYKHNGELVIPQPNLFRCLIDAGKFFKSGKSKVTTQKSSLIPACLSIDELVIPIQHKEPWEVDTRPVRIPATGGRILRHRPMFNDWKLQFSLTVDTSIISMTLVREIVDAAGRRIGLGDFRPDTKGPFGKFVVTHWEEDETGD